MPRPLLVLSVVLIAAAPLVDSGSARLAFEFRDADQSQSVQIGDADSQAAISFSPRADGTANLRVSVRTRTQASGIEYAASADLSAHVASGELAVGEVGAIARESHATLTTRDEVTETHRRVRATEVRLRIERVTETEVAGTFWINADRETEARVNGQFVAPRPPDA